MDLTKLSKEELIILVQKLQEEKNIDVNYDYIQSVIEECEENNLQHEAFMENHGMVDYGYGTGIYGAI